MRTLNRDKKALWVCKKIPNSEPQQFEAPVKRLLNTVATTSEYDIVAFGESYKEYRKATIPMSQKHLFNEGDRVYMYVTPPTKHDKLCNECDFEIKSILDSISQTRIVFKRLQSDYS